MVLEITPWPAFGLNSYTEVQRTESFSAYKQAEAARYLGHAAKAYTAKEHLHFLISKEHMLLSSPTFPKRKAISLKQ